MDSGQVALWQLFASVQALVLMFDFGLSPTLARMLGYARGGGSAESPPSQKPSDHQDRSISTDWQYIQRLSATLRWLYPRLAVAVVLLFGIVGTFALLRPIAVAGNAGSAWMAWGIVLMGSFAGLAGNSYAAMLQGMDNIVDLRRWEIVTSFVQISLSIIVLLSGGELLALVITYQTLGILSVLRNRLLLRSLHPLTLSERPSCDRKLLTSIWPAAWRSGLGVLFSQGIVQSSGLIYGQFSSASDLASFLLALRMITTVSMFSQAPFYNKLPYLAKLHAENQRATQIAVAQKGMRVAHWVFVTGALGIGLALPSLLDLIRSQTHFVSSQMWAILSLAFFVERYGAMHLQLFSLTNKIVWHIANGVTGALSIMLALAMFPLIGSIAMPAAMFLAYTGFYSIYSVKNSNKAFNINFIEFERSTAFLPAAVLIIGLIFTITQ